MCRNPLLQSQQGFLEWGSLRPKESQIKETETKTQDRIGRYVWQLVGQTKQPNSQEFISELVYKQKQSKVEHRWSFSV